MGGPYICPGAGAPAGACTAGPHLVHAAPSSANTDSEHHHGSTDELHRQAISFTTSSASLGSVWAGYSWTSSKAPGRSRSRSR